VDYCLSRAPIFMTNIISFVRWVIKINFYIQKVIILLLLYFRLKKNHTKTSKLQKYINWSILGNIVSLLKIEGKKYKKRIKNYVPV
jgi:hypothetical protein